MRTRVVVALALAAIVAYSFVLRWRILDATPFPTGIDGYFYPVQLRSLLAHGHLVYPASPLAFWFMAPFAALTDPIVGAKLGAALGGALIALPAYAIGARLGRGWGAGLLAAALATFSAGSTYLTVEYVKNGIGLTVALAALWLALRAIDRPTRRRILVAIAGVIAAILAHKMAAAIVVAIGVPAAFSAAIARGKLRGRRLIYAMLGGIAALLALLILGLVAPRRLLSTDDLRLLQGLFTDSPDWSMPAFSVPHYGLDMGHEALTGAILAIGAAVAIAWRGHPSRTVAWAFVALALLIAIPYLAVDDPQGLAFRLRLVAFIPRAMCAAIICGAIPFAHRELTYAMLAGVIAIAAPRDDQVPGEILTHPALVTSALALHIPDGGLAIVPERHIAFMIAWYANAPVALHPDGIDHDKRWRVLPGSFVELGSPLDQALMTARATPGVIAPIGVHPRHPNGMVLVAESTWDWVLAQLPPPARAHFGAWHTK
jgi:hypothetical protein